MCPHDHGRSYAVEKAASPCSSVLRSRRVGENCHISRQAGDRHRTEAACIATETCGRTGNRSRTTNVVDQLNQSWGVRPAVVPLIESTIWQSHFSASLDPAMFVTNSWPGDVVRRMQFGPQRAGSPWKVNPVWRSQDGILQWLTGPFGSDSRSSCVSETAVFPEPK